MDRERLVDRLLVEGGPGSRDSPIGGGRGEGRDDRIWLYKLYS